MDFTNDNYCFACGENNPWGLHLKFNHNDDAVDSEFILKKEHQGFKDVAHGGIVSTVLDEAMAYLCIGKGYYGVTGKIEVRFKKPVPIGEKLKVKAEITEEKSKLVMAKSRLENSKGETLAEATSVFIKVNKM